MAESQPGILAQMKRDPMVDRPSEEIRDLLRDSYFAYLCTVDEENTPHITPIFFVFHEKSNLVYFMSSLKSKKIANILLNNKVSLTVDVRDPANPFNNKGAMIEGEAHLEGELKSMKPSSNRILLKESAIGIFKMFEVKYHILRKAKPGLREPMRLVKRFSEVLVSIKPKKIVNWSGGPKFKRVEF